MRYPLQRCCRIAAMLFALGTACFAHADAVDSIKVQILSLRAADEPYTALQLQAWVSLQQWFKTKGLEIAEEPEWVFWCEVESLSGSLSGMVALSVGIGHTLPRPMMELGKTMEVAYAGLPPEKRAALTPDGKWVREYLTGQFLSRYVEPVDQKLVVVPQSELLKHLDSILSKFLKTHMKQ